MQKPIETPLDLSPEERLERMNQLLDEMLDLTDALPEIETKDDPDYD